MRSLVLLAILAVLLAAGCGLPGNYYLEPPSVFATDSGGLLGIFNTSRSNDINVQFLGYEFLYKCYYPNDPDRITDSAYSGADDGRNKLLQAGFHRLCRGQGNVASMLADSTPGDTTRPLVNIRQISPADIGESFPITFQINHETSPVVPAIAVPASYVEYTPPSTPGNPVYLETRRFVAGTGLQCKTFASNEAVVSNWIFSPPDADVDGEMESLIRTSGGYVWLMMYAFSFGRADDGSPIYSSPVYMGYIQTQIMLP
jgi:hypothetical protein